MERASDPDSREMKNHRNCLIILDIIVVVLFSFPRKHRFSDRICIWPSMYDLNWNLIVPKKMNRDDYCLKRRMKLFLIVKNILGIFHDCNLLTIYVFFLEMEEKILHSRIISIIYPELGINDARETEIINRNFFTRTREPSCITINEKVLESASSNEFLLIDRRLLFSKLFKIFPISRVFDSRWKFQFLNAKFHDCLVLYFSLLLSYYFKSSR